MVILGEPGQHRDIAEGYIGCADGDRLGLDDLIQPLVEDLDFVVARRYAGQRKAAVLGALGDGYRGSVTGL